MPKKIQQARKKIHAKFSETSREMAEKTTTLILGAISLVAAFAWNEAIKAILDKFIQPGNEFLGKIIYALVITFIFVLISLYLVSVIKKKKQK